MESLHNLSVDCNCYNVKANKMQQCIKIIIIPFLNEARHVSGDTPPIIIFIIYRRLFNVDKYGRSVRQTICMCANVNEWSHTSTLPCFYMI
jgi:hypothetical protein